MEVASSVREYLAAWTKNGEASCRAMLLPPHSNPSDPASVDLLTTAYQTLLFSLTKTWSAQNGLTVDTLTNFVITIRDSIPSSSSMNGPASRMGDVIVDVIWALDTELDDIVTDAKASPSDSKTVKENAEEDKAMLAKLAWRLAECGIVVPNICRERLDSALLGTAKFIHDQLLFEKKEIRAKTALFYKQNKFNLTREQSEGWSKFTIELTSSLGPAHAPDTGRSKELPDALASRAQGVWDRLVSLIGYFDLDPNRALDVILDVLSVHLAAHHTFILALLSCSPWAGNSQQFAGDTKTDSPPGAYNGKTLDEILNLSGAHGTSSPSSKPRVMAQVLGFKFAHYAHPDTRDPAPKSLYLTAAVLIRDGFITLEDLYPHLSPLDEDMTAALDEYKESVKSRIDGAKTSMLAMAAPLESASSARPSKQAEKNKPSAPQKIQNQKADIGIALLSIGALKPALAILSKFPWFVDAYPDIADLLLRIVSHSMSPLYDSEVAKKERSNGFTQGRARWSANSPPRQPAKKQILTLVGPTPPSTSSTDFVFFYPDWTMHVPLCSSYEDLSNVVEPLLRFIGVHISRDTVFLTKLLRLGKTQLLVDPVSKEKPTSDDDGEEESSAMRARKFWLRVIRRYIIPGISLIRGSAVCVVEVWNILKQYETTERWSVYGEWKAATYTSHPELRIRQVQADRESKGILRRLSHNTMDSLSGAIAKLSHSNPTIFFTNAVNQVMAYDNLAAVIVTALRFLTTMGFDVLTYVILEAFSNPHKDRVKDDGVNTSDWLQSLSSFTGQLFKRYSTDLTPILQYLVHQLHIGLSSEIILLKELIWKMAGIEPLPSLSDAQVSSMAGGPILCVQAVAADTRGANMDPGDVKLNATSRLGKALLESKLGLPLLIQVAQQRQSCVYKTSDTHLKSLASLFDTTHGVLLQYLDLLSSPEAVSAEDYARVIVPSLSELTKYGISAPICMQILRPILHAAMLKRASDYKKTEEERKLRLKAAAEETEKRLKEGLKARLAAARVDSPAPNGASDAGAKTTTAEEAPMIVDSVVTSEPAPQISTSSAESPWQPELLALFEDVKELLPAAALDTIGPGFYTTFWQMSTYDLSYPIDKYEEQGKHLRAESRKAEGELTIAEKRGDRTAMSIHRQRRDRLNKYSSLLTDEAKQQIDAHDFATKRMREERSHWFAHAPDIPMLTQAITVYCILPRALLSPMDADYSAQMIKSLHLLGTPRFHTLRMYDAILNIGVGSVLFSCSEYEARNYGRFLRGVLKDIKAWFMDENLYQKDNHIKGRPLPGFSRKIQTHNTILTFVEYQRLVQKWYLRLSKGFTSCINTGEFMHVYNGIIVLKEILPVFPDAMFGDGVYLDESIDHLVEKEERGDLKILARAYSAGLKKLESRWRRPKGVPVVPIPLPDPDGLKKSSVDAPPPPNGPRGSATVVPTSTAKSSAAPPSSTPSGPRAQLSSGTEITNGSSLPKSPFDTIPRPQRIKRTDRDSPKPLVETKSGQPPSGPAADRKYNLSKEDNTRPSSPLSGNNFQEKGKGHANGDDTRSPVAPPMPPPSVPSQTMSAQELRETAKQTMHRNDHRSDDSAPAAPTATNRSKSPVSPRIRSPSPSSRPGTRNASSDSRASGGKAKSTKDSRQDSREVPTRRDSLTHSRGNDRSRREGEKDERDRDRGRDRHGDRDGHRDHRGDHRDRDRHRRDEKERKDRGQPAPTGPLEDRRTDPRRVDEGPAHLGKRRRPGDDESDRGSKRPSRKDSHREDRQRRGTEKEARERSRERGKRDREETPEKGRAELPASVPSGPRAMNTETKPPRPDSTTGRDRHRDQAPRTPNPVPQEAPSASLLSRLGGDQDESRRNESRKDDDRDSRKRAMSDREKDGDRTPPDNKRFKLQRDRFNGSKAAVRMGLPINDQQGRKD